jgi:type III restriction enzyme
MYPDFLFFHQVDDEVVVDIVDPHRPDGGDTGPKWVGLARYAAEHGDKFRRVLAVIKDSAGKLVSLDLRNPDVAKRLAKATNETDIRNVFADFGGTY